MFRYLPLLAILFLTSCQSKEHNTLKTTNPYYLKLEKACNGSHCCLTSLEGMVKSNATLVPQSGICPKGFHRNMLKCIDTYQWCARDKN